MTANKDTRQLITDLWKFIEDVSEDDPERTDKFFVLRERVRQFYADEARSKPSVNNHGVARKPESQL